MKSQKTSKPLFIALLSIIAFLLFAVIFLTNTVLKYAANQSPYDYLKMTFKENSEFAPSKLLCQDISEEGISVVFYVNQNGTYDAAMLKKGFTGYKLIRCSGHIGKASTGESGYYQTSSSVDADSQLRYEISWGMLTDNEAEKVFLDEDECSLAYTTENFRIFWRTDTEKYTPSNSLISEPDPELIIV